jgi:hypothetical protein
MEKRFEKFGQFALGMALALAPSLISPDKIQAQSADQIQALRNGELQSVLVEDSPQNEKVRFGIDYKKMGNKLTQFGFNTTLLKEGIFWLQDSNCGSYLYNENGNVTHRFVIPLQRDSRVYEDYLFEGATQLPQRLYQNQIARILPEYGVQIDRISDLYCEGGDILPFVDNSGKQIFAYGRNTTIYNVIDYVKRGLLTLEDENFEFNPELIKKWELELRNMYNVEGVKNPFIPLNYNSLTRDQQLPYILRFARADQLLQNRFRKAFKMSDSVGLVEISSNNFHLDTYLRLLPIEDKNYSGLALLSDPSITPNKLKNLPEPQYEEGDVFERNEEKNKILRTKEFTENKKKLEALGFKVISIPPELPGFIPANGLLRIENGSKIYTITSFSDDDGKSLYGGKYYNYRDHYNAYYSYLRKVLEENGIELKIIIDDINDYKGSINCLTIPLLNLEDAKEAPPIGN